MIAKNIKGKSFGGCVRYVLNEGHEILAAEGVVADDAATITRDFAIQRSGRPEIKQPVGHIAVAFSPEDSARMTGDFMLQLAHEYMREMNIRNTQYIVVRHHNTDHDHFHIVYNRIDNDLKLISVNNDYHRNVAACKKLKDRHGLTYGVGKEKVNRQKLTGAEKVKYQIHDEIAANLPKCADYADLEKRLRQAGITIQYKYRSGAEESSENIQGVSFAKGKMTFKGSQVDRKFSHANISKVFNENMEAVIKEFFNGDVPSKQRSMLSGSEPQSRPQEPPKLSTEQSEQATPPVTPSPEPSKLLVGQSERVMPSPEPTKSLAQMQPAPRYPVINGIEITAEQNKTLNNGGYIWLENMELADGGGKFSAYVFLDNETNAALHCDRNPDTVVEINGYTIRIRDVEVIRHGSVAHAEMKLPDESEPKRRFVWHDKQTGGIMYSFTDPRLPVPPTVIRGVEITAEQEKTLHDGGHIWLEGIDKKDGSGKFSAYVFWSDDKTRVFFSKADPDRFVQYGEYEMRQRDKRQVEAGLTTQAIIRLAGGELTGARIWKENPEDAGYNVSWDDSHIAKEQREQTKRQQDNTLRRSPVVNRTPPAVNRTPPAVNRTIPTPSKGIKPRR
jgi:hypothetical protein